MAFRKSKERRMREDLAKIEASLRGVDSVYYSNAFQQVLGINALIAERAWLLGYEARSAAIKKEKS